MRTLLQQTATRGGQSRLSIFIFHRVLAAPDPLFPGEIDVAAFDHMLQWIGEWFRVLPLDEAVERWRQRSLPPGAAAITFDDGYADNLIHASPLLQRRGMAATLFVATGFLDGGRMWNDSIIEALRCVEPGELDLRHLDLGRHVIEDLGSRRAAIQTLIARAKHLPPARRHAAVQAVIDAVGRPLPDDLMLTSEQLRRWQRAGHGVGAHTVTHPILATLEPAQARREILEGRDALQALCGGPIPLFAYPNGRPGQDYGAEHVRMVRDAGFTAAVSTTWGHVADASDPFQLPRFTPWDRSRLPFGWRMLRNLRGGTGPSPVDTVAVAG